MVTSVHFQALMMKNLGTKIKISESEPVTLAMFNLMTKKKVNWIVTLTQEMKWSSTRLKNDDICNKVNNSIKKEVDCKPIYNIKFLKTKIRSYVDKTTDFCSRKIPEIGSNYIHWSVLVINSVLKKDENYYPQVFLKERRYIEKEKKWLDILLMT